MFAEKPSQLPFTMIIAHSSPSMTLDACGSFLNGSTNECRMVFSRYARYYERDGKLYRTLFKAYGIRYVVMVYGQVRETEGEELLLYYHGVQFYCSAILIPRQDVLLIHPLIPRVLKSSLTFIGKLSSSRLLWCCLFFSFIHFVIVKKLSILDLALLGVKGLKQLIQTSQ